MLFETSQDCARTALIWINEGGPKAPFFKPLIQVKVGPRRLREACFPKSDDKAKDVP